MRMTERLMSGLYRLITFCLLPLVFVYFAMRGRREPAYRQRWHERLGHVGHVPAHAIWIHAASVGEVNLAEPLVHALDELSPGRPIVVTTFTPTGAQRVANRLGERVVHRYLPLDTAGATRRFMQQLQPAVGILMETELWPNLLAAAERADVPVVMANASISEHSAAQYRKRGLAALMRPAMRRLAAVGAASSLHARRFVDLGVPERRVHVTGNLKYDGRSDPALPAQAAELRQAWMADNRPVWVAASTHEGEEAIVLDAHRRLREQGSDALLILAPRHPQRFDDVRDLIAGQAWSVVSRATGETVTNRTDVLLADTLGEVPLFYALADAALVGGSLVAGIGGHNMLEAAAVGCPVITGEQTGEWQDIVDRLKAAGGLCQVADSPALTAQLRVWLNDTAAARRAGDAARQCCEAERGALNRTLEMLSIVNGT